MYTKIHLSHDKISILLKKKKCVGRVSCTYQTIPILSGFLQKKEEKKKYGCTTNRHSCASHFFFLVYRFGIELLTLLL